MAATRRQALLLGAAGALGALAGCTSLARAYRVVAPTLTLPRSPLRGWDVAVRRAWASGGGMFSLGALQAGASSVVPDATWVAEAPVGSSVEPLLRSTNLPVDSLAPWAVEAFTDHMGTLTAFPMAVGQLQFYVNTERLKATGTPDLDLWTWDALETAVAPVAGAYPAILGWGWAQPATWRALVYGLNGTLMSGPIGGPTAAGVIAATQRLATLAQSSLWHPLHYLSSYHSGSGALPGGYGRFAQYGWRNPAPGFTPPLFAFMPPWTMDVFGGTSYGWHLFPPQCTTNGGCIVAPRPFPTLPMYSVVPAFAWGLQPSSSSPHPELVAEFASWVYAPEQQRSLLPVGLYPLVDNPGVMTAWHHDVEARGTVPLFDAGRYFSPQYGFSHLRPIISTYDQAFDGIFYDGMGVAASLATIGI